MHGFYQGLPAFVSCLKLSVTSHFLDKSGAFVFKCNQTLSLRLWHKS